MLPFFRARVWSSLSMRFHHGDVPPKSCWSVFGFGICNCSQQARKTCRRSRTDWHAWRKYWKLKDKLQSCLAKLAPLVRCTEKAWLPASWVWFQCVLKWSTIGTLDWSISWLGAGAPLKSAMARCSGRIFSWTCALWHPAASDYFDYLACFHCIWGFIFSLCHA